MRVISAVLSAIVLAGCQTGDVGQRYYVDYAYYMIETDPELLRDAERAGGDRQTAYCVAEKLALDIYGQDDYALLSDAAALRVQLTSSDRARIKAKHQAAMDKGAADKTATHAYLNELWQQCLNQ